MTLSRAATCIIGVSLIACSFASRSAAQNQLPAQARGPVDQQRQAPVGPAQGQPQRQLQQQATLPCPFPPLSQPEEAYLADVLRFWEERSNRVDRFECKFIRWEYDKKWGPQDPNVAKTISYGEIKYEKPDKGMFRVDRITHYTPPQADPENPQAAQQGPQYHPQPGEVGEHWVCDGKSVFVYDEPQKLLREVKLPPEMQGKGIVNGPLPFLFGAKAEKIRARYWTRMVLPAPVKGQYWLEAYPKLRDDRAQYSKVLVILDEQEYLPIAVQIFDRNFDRRENPSRVSFEFQDRIENPNLALQRLNLFHRSFFEPKLPSGWKKIVEQLPGEQSPGQPARAAQAAPPPGGATQR